MKKCSDYSPHDHKTRASMKGLGKQPGIAGLKAQRSAIKGEISAIDAEMAARKKKGRK